MNIYQEVYDIVHLYRQQWNDLQNGPYEVNEETIIKKWLYVAENLKKNASEDIIRVAQQKYPILQQIFQMNESEVRS